MSLGIQHYNAQFQSATKKSKLLFRSKPWYTQTRYFMDFVEYHRTVAQQWTKAVNRIFFYVSRHHSWLYFVFPISVHALRFSSCYVLGLKTRFVFHLFFCIVFYHYLHLKQGCRVQNDSSVQIKGTWIRIKDATPRVYIKHLWLNSFVLVEKKKKLKQFLCVLWLNVALFFISVFMSVYSCWQTLDEGMMYATFCSLSFIFFF